MQQTRSATQAFLNQQFQNLTAEQREAMILAMAALREVFEQDMPRRAADVDTMALP